MLYPRTTPKSDDLLVPDEAMVGAREHLVREHRVFLLTGMISAETDSIALLYALDSLSHDPIKLVISSGGGDLDGALLFCDTLKFLQSPIWTFGRYCASGAALILAAGEKRWLSPHAKVMLHLPTGMMGGDAADWEIQQAEMKKSKQKIVELLQKYGMKGSAKKILAEIDRDRWFEPAEAIEWGLADEIMTKEVMGDWLK